MSGSPEREGTGTGLAGSPRAPVRGLDPWRYPLDSARGAGGWGAAFGWGRPRLADTGQVLLFFLLGFGVRAIVSQVTLLVFPGLRHQPISNLHLHGLPTGVLVLAILVAVVVGPPIEELMFRGVILRAGMRRFGFLPATWRRSRSSSPITSAPHATVMTTLPRACPRSRWRRPSAVSASE